jgi:uncharacterized protein YneF (UPF0154 family)
MLILVIVGIAVFLVGVFAIVMLSGTRMTGKQLDDDPTMAEAENDTKVVEKDFPFDADY